MLNPCPPIFAVFGFCDPTRDSFYLHKTRETFTLIYQLYCALAIRRPCAYHHQFPWNLTEVFHLGNCGMKGEGLGSCTPFCQPMLTCPAKENHLDSELKSKTQWSSDPEELTHSPWKRESAFKGSQVPCLCFSFFPICCCYLL